MNASHFRERVDLELARAARHDHSTTVAFIDIDNFKNINDQHGHRMGDEALGCVAAAMREQVRSSDTVGRLGGDEFGILLPESTEQAARAVLNRIRTQIRELAAEKTWPITVGIGAATVDGVCSSATSTEVIRQADGAMYRVKSTGKDGLLLEAFE